MATNEVNEPCLAAISYAHGSYDSDVLALSDRLNKEGIDCEVDMYEDAPPKGWLQWMDDTMSGRTVLAVCTKDYEARLRGDAPLGVGRGASWEGRILKQRVYDGQGKNEGVVPVIFRTEYANYIPPFLKDVAYYDLSSEGGYVLLYRRLTRQPMRQKTAARRNAPSANCRGAARY